MEVSGLQGGKGDKRDHSTIARPPIDNAMAIVLAPDASGSVMGYQEPTKPAFTNAAGAIDALQILTTTLTGPSITSGDATNYPRGYLTVIVFNNMNH